MSFYPPNQYGAKPPKSGPFGPPLPTATNSPGFVFGAPPSANASAARSVATLAFNGQAKAWAKACGLDIVNVSWEDCARSKNSCYGPCISDMTLVSDNSWMSVLRSPNFADPIMNIPSSQIQVKVGNESRHDGVALSTVSLADYLTNIAKYTELEHSLFEPSKDNQVVVSTQACFLPLSASGDVDFHVGLFNYQSTATNPAVLVLISTDAGTSAQVVQGNQRGDILYFNDHGTKRTFLATRLSTDRTRRGVANTGAPMEQAEEARNYIMVVQIPLIGRPSVSTGMPFGASTTSTTTSIPFGYPPDTSAKPSFAFGSTVSSTSSFMSTRPSANVEPAMLSLGTILSILHEF
ncbi:hypothetical protein AaE_000215 [Aphanomyces astaci]|uniref:Uncharacterized protein n=2 Tax=Aphanomyces astaci TaxID=112090 RepID=A0A6A5AUT5_APHAT|nr:hypothetical protein AaE_000215 [Aphanomyces astaci]